jgi:hypothetical protein
VKTLLALALTFYLSLALSQTYVQVNGISLHDQSGFNEINYGAGLEQGITDRWTIAGGWYYNSDYRGSTYAYGRYAFYKKNAWDIGVAMGAVTGYEPYPVAPTLFPEVCYSYFCAVALPRVKATGANAIGFRLRIPVN